MTTAETPTGGDREEIAAVVSAFFAAFATGSDLDERVERLRSLFVPQAVITRLCGLPAAHLGVEEFLQPRRDLLASGRFDSFHEAPATGSLEVFGDLAHWFGGYTKTWTDADGEHAGCGMKSIQLVRTDAGWRITAAAWDDEP